MGVRIPPPAPSFSCWAQSSFTRKMRRVRSSGERLDIFTLMRYSVNMKTCGKCSAQKPLSDFNKGKSKDGKHSWCKTCVAADRRAWDKANPQRKREQNWWTRYRLRPVTIYALLEQQGNRCLLCPTDITTSFAVDHNHACCPGKTSCGACIRGLLCVSCNTKLGWYERRKEVIANYLS